MINLTPKSEPYDLELPYGIAVTVQPLTTASMLTAQAAARKAADKEIEQAADELSKDLRDGLYQAHLIYELATRHIKALKGVELDGKEAPATPENVKAVMDLYPVGERFYQEFTLQQLILNSSKNVSRPSASGTSKEAAGRTTAKAAKT
ncbi:MAG: hypothetical protein H6867_04800 [Rhodospirillales bacterium]|nr:hypothetical protein [Rhodospirillales bacterium]MCB9994820.1 hypothetical protein [Rhodospirillales bacterium]